MLGFRVWHTKAFRFLDDQFLLHYSMDPNGNGMGGIYHSESNIFLQSTGLADDNGVIIYEGDILDYRVIDIEADIDMSLFVHVENVVDFFCERKQFRFENGPFTSVTIAGNRFENPELLEKVSK